MYSLPEDIFQLNIGGTHKMIVTKGTLCKFQESALAAMFSGRHKLQKFKGRIFIDRDGDSFSSIISYLRNGKPPLFASKQQENAFYDELDYWQIPMNQQKSEPITTEEFDPNWCASTLQLGNNNMLVRKNGKKSK